MLVEEGQHYIKSDAILRIASRLMLPMPLVAAALMPFPYFVKDTFYDQVGSGHPFSVTAACVGVPGLHPTNQPYAHACSACSTAAFVLTHWAPFA